MRRVQIHAIVAPVSVAWKLSDGHQLNGSDSEVPEIVQLRLDAREGSLRRERTGVQLVEDVIFEWEAFPFLIGPRECIRIDDLRGAMNAMRLRSRNGIGTQTAIFKHERVAIARLGIWNIR